MSIVRDETSVSMNLFQNISGGPFVTFGYVTGMAGSGLRVVPGSDGHIVEPRASRLHPVHTKPGRHVCD